MTEKSQTIDSERVCLANRSRDLAAALVEYERLNTFKGKIGVAVDWAQELCNHLRRLDITEKDRPQNEEE